MLQIVEDMGLNSGISSMLLNYYRHIDKERISFDFITFKPIPENVKKYCEDNGSRVFYAGELSGKRIINGELERCVDNIFSRYEGEYSIVHCHETNLAFVILKLAQKHNIHGRIIHSHNSRGADGALKKVRNHILHKMGLKYATDFWACSRKAAVFLYGTDEGKVIINNAIELESYRFNTEARNKIRGELNCKENTFVIGHVGRFAEQKNHKYLINVYENFCEKHPGIDTKLVLIGDGELIGEVKNEVEKIRHKSGVVFVGLTDRVKEYVQGMDVFALPSLYEGLPVVAVEAQAAGLACIISNQVTDEVKVLESTVMAGITSKDVDIWCDELYSIYNQVEKSGYDRSQAYNIVAEAGFDINIESKRLEKYYMSIVGRIAG